MSEQSVPLAKLQYRALLGSYLRPQSRRVIILSLLLFASIAVQVINPLILRQFIDAIQSPGSGTPLATLAALFIALALGQQLLSVAAAYFGEMVAWTATNALRGDLALHCLRLDLGFHKSRTPGELIERIDGDITAMANFFSRFVIQVLGSLVLLAAVLVMLWTVHWTVGFWLTLFAVVVLAAMVTLRSFVVPYWHAARQASAELFGFLEERLAGTVDIRSSGARPYVMNRLYTFMGQRYQTGRKARIMGSIPWSVPVVAFAAGQGLAFTLGASLYLGGTATLGTAFLIYYYTQLIFQPLQMISHQIEDLQKATAGMARVQELMGIRSALDDGPGAAIPAGPLAVDFAAVNFGYEGDAPVVHDLTLNIAPGQVIGLLGRTGSGKTTLTRLMLRLYDPASGVVRVGGVDVRQAKLADLRRHVAMVTQDVQLFRATVRDNLTLFDERIGDERIMAALEELGLVEWCKRLPQGLDTMLQAGGGGLSAGEAQLLAFTRIFLKDPGLVILDEATSRVDPSTQSLIERAVGRLLRDRTGIIIAHRLETVQRADTIVILEGGHIVESGPREALALNAASRFARLLRSGSTEELA